ncbi:response regulator transcription factor [Vibrio vulnificus]|uniref:response regulator transcription factor n=1 Tax=Vibrio vulnificus TaxID=672 RepID=UPI003EDA5539
MLPTLAALMLVIGLFGFISIYGLSRYRHLKRQLRHVEQRLSQAIELNQHMQLANNQLISALKRDFQLLKPHLIDAPAKELEQHIDALLDLAQFDKGLESAEPLSLILLQPWLKAKLECFHALADNPSTIHVRDIPDLMLSTHRELLDAALTLCCELLTEQQTKQTFVLDCEFDAQFTLRLACPAQVKEPLSDCRSVNYHLLARRVTAVGGDFQITFEGEGLRCAVIALPANLVPLKVPIRNATHQAAEQNKAHIMIVESDPEMIEWLDYHLCTEFRISWCQSVQGAEHELEQESPELILCDAQLSDGNALDWLQSIRSREEWSAIPFVICSMDAGEQSRVAAWQASADDCLRKNMQPLVLIARLKALIENRRLIQKKMLNQALSRHKITEESELDLSNSTPDNSSDSQFVEQLRLIFDRYLTSQELTVEFMAEQFHMSVRSYQRRIQAVFGIPYSQYLKQVQFEVAKAALASGQSVKEAAFHAGFRDQAYFGRVFRKEFGLTPTEFKKTLKST